MTCSIQQPLTTPWERKTLVGGEPGLFRRELPYRLAAALSGALLGLSAPGPDQWYLAWFGLVPMFYLTFSAREPWLAGVRGWYFATAYNLVYLSWYLSFRPVFSAGTFAFCPAVMNILFWTAMAAWQGLFVSIFSCVASAVPLTAGWFPRKHHGRWLFPSFIAIPFLWILIDRMCNAPVLLGVPWSSLEYSQYKQLPIIQAASIIGGVGIGACIILANATILSCFKRADLAALSYPSRKAFVINTAISVLVLLAIPIFGLFRLEADKQAQPQKKLVTAIQANLAGKVHKVNTVVTMTKYVDLCRESPAGSLVIWPEWGLEAVYQREKRTFQLIATIPGRRNQNWVVGAIDSDERGHEYNAVCSMDRRGNIGEIYHKRYLVPLGEFTPDWVRETPVGTIIYGPNKKYDDTTPDDKIVVFKLPDATVGPLLCFECIMPKLACDSTKAGAQILADCSNTSWFFNSILSDQMHAFCTMRAVENHRSFVFSTCLGPSLIIDSVGRHLKEAPREKEATISAMVPIESDITPFTRFCF
jgi:apolipoprotein N-acyltransferase